MNSQPFTPDQIRFAHKLACAHGHLWATTLTEEEAVACGTPREFIQALEAAGVHPDEKGIWHPILASIDPELGTIGHTTFSGRARWLIDREDGASLTVWRPDPEGGRDGHCVLHVFVYYTGQVDLLHGDTPQLDDSLYAERHVQALADMLRPLIGEERTTELVQPLFKLAEPVDQQERRQSLLGEVQGLASYLDDAGLQEVIQDLRQRTLALGLE